MEDSLKKIYNNLYNNNMWIIINYRLIKMKDNDSDSDLSDFSISDK